MLPEPIDVARALPRQSNDAYQCLHAALALATCLSGRAARLEGAAFGGSRVSLNRSVGVIAQRRHGIAENELPEIRIQGHPRQQVIDVLSLMAPGNFWVHDRPLRLLN